MADERTRGVLRFETIVATFIGICALTVSGYTAYVQRQQVRAAVWPILEFGTSNGPEIRLTVENKGVGPAIVRHVKVTVDGQPMRDWHQALDKMLGPGRHSFAQSTISNHVLSAGESMSVLVPHGVDGKPLTPENPDPLYLAMNEARGRVGVEICYCSTLGECWLLRGDEKATSTTEIRTCPERSADTFEQ